MLSRDLDLHHVFSLRIPRGSHAVVATSTLGATYFERRDGHTRHARTRKLIARNIEFLYFGRAEDGDATSLVRSQMSGTADIDALVERPPRLQ